MLTLPAKDLIANGSWTRLAAWTGCTGRERRAKIFIPITDQFAVESSQVVGFGVLDLTSEPCNLQLAPAAYYNTETVQRRMQPIRCTLFMEVRGLSQYRGGTFITTPDGICE